MLMMMDELRRPGHAGTFKSLVALGVHREDVPAQPGQQGHIRAIESHVMQGVDGEFAGTEHG